MNLLRRTLRFVLTITTIGATLALALVLGRAVAVQQTHAGQQTQAEQRAGSPASQANAAGLRAHDANTARAIVATSLNTSITVENPILGYRVSLPEGYRQSGSLILTGAGLLLGRDAYTTVSEAEERGVCLEDQNGTPSPRTAAYVQVQVYRNVTGSTALDWATNPPQRWGPRTTVEAVTIGGRDAVRLVEDGISSGYVIRANDRFYLLSPVLLPSQHPLDDIAASFTAIAPQSPPPAIVPALAPRDAASQLGAALSRAFAARDADAIARLLPACWLAVSATIDARPQGGVLNRSVTSFVDGLRTRFAAGDLTVTVDPRVQIQPQREVPDRFFVSSVWADPDRTTRIDLFFGATADGRWQWIQASPHYLGTDAKRGCLPYRSPWITGTPGC